MCCNSCHVCKRVAEEELAGVLYVQWVLNKNEYLIQNSLWLTDNCCGSKFFDTVKGKGIKWGVFNKDERAATVSVGQMILSCARRDCIAAITIWYEGSFLVTLYDGDRQLYELGNNQDGKLTPSRSPALQFYYGRIPHAQYTCSAAVRGTGEAAALGWEHPCRQPCAGEWEIGTDGEEKDPLNPFANV